MSFDTLGRYEVINEIARGGMAIVYLAKDSYMERLVAVKVLPRVFMHDPQFEKRFTREAKVVASLEHPAIVPVYDFGYHDEQPFMVYRYMSGGTLKDKIQREGAKSLAQTIKFISRIAPAIDKAHEKGIIHRDLKPSNILFDDDDKAYVADFGIAKIVESTSHLTGNAIVGTPAYMSPEQFTGDADVGRYSDIYALGIILYELLSGELPFKADTTPRLMKLHIMDPVPSIRSIRSELPREIDNVLAKALAKKTEDRYQSVGELKSAFGSVLRETPAIHDVHDRYQQEIDDDATIREPEWIRNKAPSTKKPEERAVDNGAGEEGVYLTMDAPQPVAEDILEMEIVEESQKAITPKVRLPRIQLPPLSVIIEEVLKNKSLLAVLLVGLGWSVGNAIGTYIMSTDPLYILATLFMAVGAAGGLSLALGLKWLVPSLSWPRVLIIAAGWFIAWASIWYVGEALGIQPSWEPQYLVIQVGLSGIGGLITGLSLFWDEADSRWQRSLNLFLGWGVASAIGIMLAALMSVESWFENYYVIDEAISLNGFLVIFTIGIIGASITVKQLRKTNLFSPESGVVGFSDTVGVLWRKYRFAFILLLLAWPISEIVISVLIVQLNYDTTLLFIINGSFGAILTGFAIKQIRSGVRWLHIFLFTLAWAAFWELRWHIAGTLGVERGGFNDGWSIIRLFAAGLAGLAMGLILRQSGFKLRWKGILRLAAGWFLGWGLATIIAWYLATETMLMIRWTTSFADIHIPWVLCTVVVGLVGGVYTIREILNTEPEANIPHQS